MKVTHTCVNKASWLSKNLPAAKPPATLYLLFPKKTIILLNWTETKKLFHWKIK